MEERQISQAEMEEEQAKLQMLVNVAFQDGLAKAIDTARKMNDPYILDALHDALADQLYQELVKRGKLEEL